MSISLHSHSGEFCCHAKGTLEEVVLEAIKQGFKTYGLSEHCPRYARDHLYPEELHLSVEDLTTKFEAYLVEAWRLKAKHASAIQLLVGVETEFIDKEGLDKLAELLEKHTASIEYVVGSVHHCHGLPIDFDKPGFDAALSTTAGDHEAQYAALLNRYFDAQYELLYRLKPEVVGHFDLCRLYYPSLDLKAFPSAWQKIERNVDLAVSYGALFEVNAAAFRKGWDTAYPGAEVFTLIRARGGRFTLSDDSHGPQAVGLNYVKALKYLADQELDVLWSLESQGRGSRARPVTLSEKSWL